MLISADVLVLLEEEQTMAGAQFFPDIGLMVRGLDKHPSVRWDLLLSVKTWKMSTCRQGAGIGVDALILSTVIGIS